MKDPIANFVDAWNRWDRAQHPDNTTIDWSRRFRDAGYYPARLDISAGSWTAVERWCRQHFGDGHFIWTGTTFWFENQRDAVLFTLRWS